MEEFLIKNKKNKKKTFVIAGGVASNFSIRKNYNVVFTSTESNDAKLVTYSINALNVGYDNEKYNGNNDYYFIDSNFIFWLCR